MSYYNQARLNEVDLLTILTAIMAQEEMNDFQGLPASQGDALKRAYINAKRVIAFVNEQQPRPM